METGEISPIRKTTLLDKTLRKGARNWNGNRAFFSVSRFYANRVRRKEGLVYSFALPASEFNDI